MATEQWQLDPVHSRIQFTVRHLMIAHVHGHFTRWSGVLAFDEEQPADSCLKVELETASLTTGEEHRDAHVRGPEFFDAERFPTITFINTRVTPSGEGHYQVEGDLDMHGVTRRVILDVEYFGRAHHPQLGERLGFRATTTLDRTEFGISFNQALETGGFMLSDEVELRIDAEAVRQE